MQMIGIYVLFTLRFMCMSRTLYSALRSDVAGFSTSLFTLSMTRNFRRSFITDFVRVEGLPGVYLANQLSKEVFEDPSMIRRQGKVYEDFVQTKVSAPRWSV